jgi:hypothetical protein
VHSRTILVGAAMSAGHSKCSYLEDKFHRHMAGQSRPEMVDGFKGPVLTALIERTIGGSLGLQQAVLRVVESVTARSAPALPVCAGSTATSATRTSHAAC